MTLLHWTCDRGNLEMLNALLKLSADPNIQVYFAFNDFIFMPRDWRLQGILFLSCLSFHKSVWNFTLANNFWTMKTRALIFHMSIPSGKTFQRVPTSFTLWPWPWSLNFFQKTLTLLINVEKWVLELLYFRWVFYVTRTLRGYQQFWPCDFDVWPTF